MLKIAEKRSSIIDKLNQKIKELNEMNGYLPGLDPMDNATNVQELIDGNQKLSQVYRNLIATRSILEIKREDDPHYDEKAYIQKRGKHFILNLETLELMEEAMDKGLIPRIIIK